MPHRNKRKKYNGRRRKKTNKKGLNKKEKNQVVNIAKLVNIKMTEPKQFNIEIGTFFLNTADYEYLQPHIISAAGTLMGSTMTNETTSIPIANIPYGMNPDTRKTMNVHISGINYNMYVSYCPASLTQDCICRFMLVSTLNDPAGGNLSFISGQPQNRLFHIPSLLCPPADTLGMRYTNDKYNLESLSCR